MPDLGGAGPGHRAAAPHRPRLRRASSARAPRRLLLHRRARQEARRSSPRRRSTPPAARELSAHVEGQAQGSYALQARFLLALLPAQGRTAQSAAAAGFDAHSEALPLARRSCPPVRAAEALLAAGRYRGRESRAAEQGWPSRRCAPDGRARPRGPRSIAGGPRLGGRRTATRADLSELPLELARGEVRGRARKRARRRPVAADEASGAWREVNLREPDHARAARRAAASIPGPGAHGPRSWRARAPVLFGRRWKKQGQARLALARRC
jgi:hypothetical protein